MNNPTIIIKYQCQESLEWMPDVYIKTIRESLAGIAHNEVRLHEVKLELKSAIAQIEEYESQTYLNNSGFIAARRDEYED